MDAQVPEKGRQMSLMALVRDPAGLLFYIVCSISVFAAHVSRIMPSTAWFQELMPNGMLATPRLHRVRHEEASRDYCAEIHFSGKRWMTSLFFATKNL